MQEPEYNLEGFIKMCRERTANFFIIRGAKSSAAHDFALDTDDEILDFIGNGGLEEPKFINRKEWENNPNRANAIWIDAYDFYSGPRFGYFAFFHSSITQKWMIKSLKKNKNPDPRNLPFKDLSWDLIKKGGLKNEKNK